jgi:hypothetical protein
MINLKEQLCDKCLADFERCMAEGRYAEVEVCKKCKAKIDRIVEEGLQGYKPELG